MEISYMEQNKTLFGDFSKAEDLEDGSLYIEAILSTESRDAQGELIKASAIEKAIPAYMRFGNVREMHQLKASGKAAWMEVRGTETHVGIRVVDKDAIAKCKSGVYNGLSVHAPGRSVRRDPSDRSVIVGLELDEISLVDRPCNPEATFTFMKVSQEMSQEMSDEQNQVVDKETKEPDASESAELWDCRAGIEAALAVSELLYAEESEPEQEAEQIALLKTAKEALEKFVALEIAETHESEDDGDVALSTPAAKDGDLIKGDYPGHPFHGNQHVGGEGEGGAHNIASRKAHEASKSARSEKEHANAAKKHERAARLHEKNGNENARSYHEAMAKYHSGKSAMVGKADKMSKNLGLKKSVESQEGDLIKVSGELKATRDDLAKALGAIETLAESHKALYEQIKDLKVRSSQPRVALRAVGKDEDSSDVAKRAPDANQPQGKGSTVDVIRSILQGKI